MIWIDLVYLGVGVGVGVGCHRLLFPRSKETDQDVATLSKQLRQTELAYQLAHQLSQFKGGFLVRVSHELRSPLNSLIGVHQLILADLCDDPAEEREFLAQAHQSALKMVKLMDEILAVSKTEHGTNQPQLQPLQLAPVLQQVYNLTYLLAADSNLRLQCLLPDSELYAVADPAWLQQVLVNLLDTCITQMEEGSICVSAQAELVAKTVYIWLDAQLQVSIWSEPLDLMQFEHPLDAQENNLPATGLALLLNQSLLEVMEGRLEVFPVQTADYKFPLTRIQITIPLVIPEDTLLEQEESRA